MDKDKLINYLSEKIEIIRVKNAQEKNNTDDKQELPSIQKTIEEAKMILSYRYSDIKRVMEALSPDMAEIALNLFPQQDVIKYLLTVEEKNETY